MNDAHEPARRRAQAWREADAEPTPDWPAPLTREQAAQVLRQAGTVSPWRVVVVQALLGAIMAAAAAWVWREPAWAWSVAYGAACCVVPAALMARGMTSRFAQVHPAAAAMGFVVWELGKLGVAAFMLAMAPRWVPALSWPALLVGLVVCLKVYWVALLWQRKPATV